MKKSGKTSVGLTPPTGAGSATVGFRPLYRQVKDLLMNRLSDGSWMPGQLLPSEPEIAADLGVSPGTVRKALDEMSAERLLVRRQGRGTFVARHDDERILFQFFRLVPDSGERRFPESHTFSVSTGKADAKAAARLHLAASAPIIVIERLRSINGQPCIDERIVLPQALFPDLHRQGDLPNNLYDLYSRQYGITVARGTERIKAVAADSRQAKRLKARSGDPMLLIDRIALDVNGTPVEWRRSVCRTEQLHYLSELK